MLALRLLLRPRRRDLRLPLGNGIITVDTDEQAWARARAGELNKGGDAARAALSVLRIKRRLAKA